MIEIAYRVLVLSILSNALLYSTSLNNGAFTSKELGLCITMSLSLVILTFAIVHIREREVKLQTTDIAAFLYLLVIPIGSLTLRQAILPVVVQQLSFGGIYFILRLLTSYITFPKIVRYFMEGIVYTTVLQLILYITNLLTKVSLFQNASWGSKTFFNPGPFGIYMALLCPLLLHFTFKNYTKVVNLKFKILFLSCLTIVFFSFSRSAWIGLIVAIFLTKINLLKKIYLIKALRLYYVAATIIAVGLVFCFYFLNPASANGRILIWKSTLLLVKNNLLFGIGTGKFSIAYPVYQASILSISKNERYIALAGDVRYAFNDTLQIFAENGVFGFVLFLMIAVTTLKALITLLRRQNNVVLRKFLLGILGMLTVLLVSGLFSYPLQIIPIALIFWSLCAIITSLNGQQPILRFKLNVLSIYLVSIFLILMTITSINYSFKAFSAHIEWLKVAQSNNTSSWQSVIDNNSILNYNPAFLYEMANVYSEKEKYQYAITLYQQAKALSPDKKIIYELAFCLKNIGETKVAVNQLKQVINRYPNLLRPKYEIALIYYGLRKRSQFYFWANNVLSFSPKVDNSETAFMKEDIAYKLQDFN